MAGEGFKIQGASGVNFEALADGSALTTLGKDTATAGYAVMMSENDDGTITGDPLLLSPETTSDFRLRTGIDTLFLSEAFNYAAQNTGAFSTFLTTMTATYTSGLLNLNAGSSVVANAVAIFKSNRVTPLYGASPTYFEWTALYVTALQADNVMEIGAGIPSTGTPFALNDGVVFRYTAAGTLVGVVNNAGTETVTGPMAIPAVNTAHRYTITIAQTEVEFWIDDVLQAKIDVPGGLGSPCSESSLPAMCRIYNAATFAGSAQILKLANVTTSLGDWSTGKHWPHQMSAAGLNAAQGAGGMTQGQTANYANSAAPASATLSNTTSGYTALGGQFQFAAVAGAETDYALFAFQVPASSVAVTGRTLYITGVEIDVFNSVVPVATTSTVFQWALAFGSTAVSLATAEAANAKAPRRVPLGVASLPVGAAVGEMARAISRKFETPYCVNPGEFTHIILKMPVATATATEIFRGVVSINAYWE